MAADNPNTLTLLINGEQYFPRVRQVIEEARSEILLETFILFDDTVGRNLQRALIEAARRGVAVDLTVDGYGSDGLSSAFIEELTGEGVRVHIFDPRPRLLGIRTNIFRRMHRKILVADGRTALVGGINFSADHLSSYGPQAKQDYALEIRGPLAADIRTFAHDALQDPGRTGRRKPSRARPDGRAPENETNARLVVRDNDRHRNDIERTYRAGIRLAQTDILIANAYFFPGYRLLRDIVRAARRGVRVRLILQGQPDMRIARWAARLLYQYLSDAGVGIYEYCKRPLHGKVACADEAWSTVGSSNLDPFSLALNLEANVFVQDAAFTAALREALEDLLAQDCRPATIVRRKHGGLRRLWTAVVVFHVLRRFPAWSGSLPAHKPQLHSAAAPEPGTADGRAGS
ncbi:cardiolipin synthase ClsB [Castellaniella ginsengisoli]|uniref:Cardiolipin synthase B n=1 Tax=Castellaniella ginsengisoli TaxID=546114 RepID=A0AB39CHS0_9BURK